VDNQPHLRKWCKKKFTAWRLIPKFAVSPASVCVHRASSENAAARTPRI